MAVSRLFSNLQFVICSCSSPVHFLAPPLSKVEGHVPFLNIWLRRLWTVGSRWTCFGVRVPRTLDYPTVNLNPRYKVRHIIPCDHNARPSQTNRQTDGQTEGRTDEHHDNSATIRSKERIAQKSMKGISPSFGHRCIWVHRWVY